MGCDKAPTGVGLEPYVRAAEPGKEVHRDEAETPRDAGNGLLIWRQERGTTSYVGAKHDRP